MAHKIIIQVIPMNRKVCFEILAGNEDSKHPNYLDCQRVAEVYSDPSEYGDPHAAYNVIPALYSVAGMALLMLKEDASLLIALRRAVESCKIRIQAGELAKNENFFVSGEA